MGHVFHFVKHNLKCPRRTNGPPRLPALRKLQYLIRTINYPANQRIDSGPELICKVFGSANAFPTNFCFPSIYFQSFCFSGHFHVLLALAGSGRSLVPNIFVFKFLLKTLSTSAEIVSDIIIQSLLVTIPLVPQFA